MSNTVGTRCAAIVDAYSTTSNELVPLLAKYGITCIHIQSEPEVRTAELPGYNPRLFDTNIVYQGNVGDTAAELDSYAPEFVLAGSESGVALADELSERLQLPSNGIELSSARRDKAIMAETLRKSGLAAPVTREVRSVDEAVAAAEAIEGWPIVLKPVNSASSDGLHFCDDIESVRKAAGSILGTVNLLGSVNDTILVQQLLLGQQYFINTVSRDGRHYVAEIWCDEWQRVPGAGVVCVRETLVPFEGEIQAQVCRYVEACLDALGVEVGPAYSEVMLTEEGPVLIECGARMIGWVDNAAIVAALGDSQVSWTATCYADPEEFARKAASAYRIRKHTSAVLLINHHKGRVRDLRGLERIATLPTFFSQSHTPAVGEIVRPTIDLRSTCGMIYLVSDNVQEIERDYQVIRHLEASTQLFGLDPIDGQSTGIPGGASEDEWISPAHDGLLTQEELDKLVDNAPKCGAMRSSIHGYGLGAREAIRQGEVVIDFGDPTLFYEIPVAELEEWRLLGGKFTALSSEMGLISDRLTKYSLMNHCRTPNCEIDVARRVIFASRDIQKGEEVTIDYRLEPMPPLAKPYFEAWL